MQSVRYPQPSVNVAANSSRCEPVLGLTSKGTSRDVSEQEKGGNAAFSESLRSVFYHDNLQNAVSNEAKSSLKEDTTMGKSNGSTTLSKRAQAIVKRVEGIMNHCSEAGRAKHTLSYGGASNAVPPLAEEEVAMSELLSLLFKSPIASLLVDHMEIVLCNRFCVVATPVFTEGEFMGRIRVCGTYAPGTIGRSYIGTQSTDAPPAEVIKEIVTDHASSRLSTENLMGDVSGVLRVLKTVGFVLRKELLESVLAEQISLVNLNSEHILKIVDILQDEHRENMIVVSSFQPRGNVTPYAGKLHSQPEKLRQIINDVGAALLLLHTHRFYHHNLKLENVLETADSRFCVADAGFSKLFTNQCPEALVFNGELVCLAPEVFDPNGPYASDDPHIQSENPSSGVTSKPNYDAKVDVWGFGIFMYRLAYGQEPFQIINCTYDEVKHCILNETPQFTDQRWSFAADLVHAISACLTKDPTARPTMAELLNLPFFTEHTGIAALPMSLPCPTTSIGSSAGLAGGTGRSGSRKGVFHTQTKNGYIVDAVLGKGRHSEALLVHLRRNPSKRFTFKIIHKLIHTGPQGEGDKTRMQHILLQVAVMQKLRHPNLVQCYNVVENKKNGYFVIQEFIQGGSLKFMPPVCTRDTTQCSRFNIKSSNGASLTLKSLLIDVLLGLVCLHDNDIPHLCLMPSNILFDDSAHRYKLNDFGPLSCTPEEIIEANARGSPYYFFPPWILAALPANPFIIDTFCVGLLAASAVPSIFQSVWSQLRCVDGCAPLSPDGVMQAVCDPGAKLPEKLIAFISNALYDNRTARQLLCHPYLEYEVNCQSIQVERVKVSAVEVAHAMQPKPESFDELRIVDVLGHDPFLESQVLSSVTGDMSENSAFGDMSLFFEFKGSNPRCSQCHVELMIALYCCTQCEDYIRCGKCSVNDYHLPGHQLVPYIIRSIERYRDDTNRALLYHPAAISDIHAIETIEMGANFPVGSFSGIVANHRSLERTQTRSSLRGTRSSSQNITKTMLDLGSTTFLPDTIEQSCSMLSVPNTTPFKVSNTTSAVATFTMVQSQHSRAQSNFHLPLGSSAPDGGCATTNATHTNSKTRPSTLVLPHPPPLPVGKAALRLKSNAKSVALPKAKDMIDLPWQEELEHCRSMNHSELLLFNYGFEQVPAEVFAPPPLHIVVLDLSQNKLGSLPPELHAFVNLRKLILSYNHLVALPDTLGSLEALEVLDASHNRLKQLPHTFTNLTKLQSIALDYNEFLEIPPCILDILPPHSVHSREHRQDQNRSHISINSLSMRGYTAPQNSAFSALRLIYLASNDSITSFPDSQRFLHFEALTIVLDNEPSLYKTYQTRNLQTELPNVTINWNKIYPDEIIPGLYCGSLRSAQSQMIYRKLNITYVLTVGRDLVPVPPEGGKHKVIIVDDIPGSDIVSSFNEAIEFIDESQKNGKGCLVHCFAGLSRSATTVIAYLMIRQHMRLDEAYLLTKKGRPAILPNSGFFDQLIKLDEKLFPNPKRPLDIASLERPL